MDMADYTLDNTTGALPHQEKFTIKYHLFSHSGFRVLFYMTCCSFYMFDVHMGLDYRMMDIHLLPYTYFTYTLKCFSILLSSILIYMSFQPLPQESAASHGHWNASINTVITGYESNGQMSVP